MTSPHDATLERFEDELAALDGTDYDLTLFVSGASDLAARAIANARRLCDVHLHGRCHLSVVDVHEDPAAVLNSRLLATPTLVRNRPLPMRRVVGDLSDTDKVLRALDLPLARPTSTDRLDTSCPDSPRPYDLQCVGARSRSGRVGPHARRDRDRRQRSRRSDDAIRCADPDGRGRGHASAIAAGEVDAFVLSDGGRPARVHAVDR